MRQRIRAGEELTGMFLSEVAAPNLLRLMQAAGLDYVIVDCEHGSFDYSQVSALAAVANGIRFPMIVRIPSADRECIQKYLDAGADGLLLPMTESVKQAEQLVRFGRYAPEGKRGISTMRPHSNYNPGVLTEYTRQANERVMLFVQIETKRGVKQIREILSIPGLDGVWIGPNDLACDLGGIGDFAVPGLEESMVQVTDAAKACGLPCGIISSRADLIRKCRRMGMTMFSCDSEMGLLKKGILAMREQVQ